jgi:predicted nuclease of predicted toxin-antitoxin system
LRFFLDEGVDAAVSRVFTERGHECWIVARANLSGSSDDDVTVYADDHDAVVVAHDKEFSQRRSKNVIGKHLWLRCREEDAVEIVGLWFDVIIDRLSIASDVWVVATRSRVDHKLRWNGDRPRRPRRRT